VNIEKINENKNVALIRFEFVIEQRKYKDENLCVWGFPFKCCIFNLCLAL